MSSRLANHRTNFRLPAAVTLRANLGRWRFSTLLLALAFGVSASARGQGPSFPAAPVLERYGGPRVAQQPDRPPAAVELPPEASSEPAPAAKEADARAEQHAAVLKLIASNHDAAQKRHEELKKDKADWEAKLNQLAVDGLGEPRPFSFLSLDKARDELAAETQSGRALRDALAAAKEAVAQATEAKTGKERDLRRAKDALDDNQDPAAIVPLTTAVADAEHAVKVVDKQLELRRLESANVQLEKQIQTLRQAYAERKADLYAQDVVFTQAMLDEVLGDLDTQIRFAAASTRNLERNLDYLHDQWVIARRELDDARISQDQANLAVLEAKVQAKDLAHQAADGEISILVTKQERLQDLKPTWQHRFALANFSVSPDDAVDWEQETKTALEKLRSDRAILNARIESIRKQLASVEKKQRNTEDSQATAHQWLDQSSRTLEQLRRTCEKALADIDTIQGIHQKLLDDLTSGTLSDTASRWLAEAAEYVRYAWDYPLATVSESEITVGRIVKGMILLLVGVYASRLLSRMFGRRLLSRMGVNVSAAAALQSVAFYLLVLIFGLFALKLIDVPLTAFTVLGGAVALGVGFGSQNIVNNFISGLILLAERPVKVGDLIQLADLYGNVEHIGPRSTRVRTGENLDIIVPNSTFLETNVVNWTLSDNHMRTKVAFGVAYGSPTGKVSHLALKAAANHDRVFDRPAPFVIFNDFGDNALVFELHFWVAVRTLMERRRIESDIRFNIDHLFREAGITIAFPQRDVHLFTQNPIRVEMAPPPSESSESTASDAA